MLEDVYVDSYSDEYGESPAPPVAGESNRMGGTGAIRHSPPR